MCECVGVHARCRRAAQRRGACLHRSGALASCALAWRPWCSCRACDPAPVAPATQPTPPPPAPPRAQLSLRFPFRSAQQVAAGRAVGASYLLTYLDGDMLIGRAPAPAGSFVFVRADE